TCQFFDAQRVGQQRLAQSAVFRRDHQSEQTHFAHLVDDRLRIAIGALQLGRVRDDFLLDELFYRGDDLVLNIGQANRLGKLAHKPSSSSLAGDRLRTGQTGDIGGSQPQARGEYVG